MYYGQEAALSNVCLEVAHGEMLGIIGPNGGGKSTLLKAILGLVEPTSGSVRIYGQEPCKNHAAVGFVPQFGAMDRRFPISVFEVVLTGRLKPGLSLFRKYSETDKAIAAAQLERVGIGHLANKQISELSGGEFQRLLIARALAVEPKLLLLDEPTASVDANSRNQIYQLLREVNADMTIILVTHDLMVISSDVGKLACLKKRLK